MFIAIQEQYYSARNSLLVLELYRDDSGIEIPWLFHEPDHTEVTQSIAERYHLFSALKCSGNCALINFLFAQICVQIIAIPVLVHLY